MIGLETAGQCLFRANRSSKHATPIRHGVVTVMMLAPKTMIGKEDKGSTKSEYLFADLSGKRAADSKTELVIIVYFLS